MLGITGEPFGKKNLSLNHSLDRGILKNILKSARINFSLPVVTHSNSVLGNNLSSYGCNTGGTWSQGSLPFSGQRGATSQVRTSRVCLKGPGMEQEEEGKFTEPLPCARQRSLLSGAHVLLGEEAGRGQPVPHFAAAFLFCLTRGFSCRDP